MHFVAFFASRQAGPASGRWMMWINPAKRSSHGLSQSFTFNMTRSNPTDLLCFINPTPPILLDLEYSPGCHLRS